MMYVRRIITPYTLYSTVCTFNLNKTRRKKTTYKNFLIVFKKKNKMILFNFKEWCHQFYLYHC